VRFANNSLALDVYCWLTYRLHALSGPTPITWKALHTRFGWAFARRDHFRQQFRHTLDLTLSVYPGGPGRDEGEGGDALPEPAAGQVPLAPPGRSRSSPARHPRKIPRSPRWVAPPARLVALIAHLGGFE
jgi:hypothetical protein